MYPSQARPAERRTSRAHRAAHGEGGRGGKKKMIRIKQCNGIMDTSITQHAYILYNITGSRDGIHTYDFSHILKRMNFTYRVT